MQKSVVINQEVCIGCGACVKDCPGKAIQMEDKKAAIQRPCITCGHCVAICPTGAVSIPEYEMGEVEEYNPETFTVLPEHFLHAVKFRRSVRNFKEMPLEEETLAQIMDAGRYTATAKNLQATTFVAVQNGLPEFKKLFWAEFPALLQKFQETNPEYVRAFTLFYEKWKKNPLDDTFFFNTPCLLITATDNPLDGGLAAANMENMAVAMGAGALYSGYLQRSIGASEVLLDWLGLRGRTLSCCMLIGYPAVKYKRTAPRKKGDVRVI